MDAPETPDDQTEAAEPEISENEDVDLDSVSGGTDRGIYNPEWLSDSYGK